MKKLCKCLLAMFLLASIVLPMGGCRPESSSNQGSTNNQQSSQGNSQGSGQTNNQGSGNNSQSGSGEQTNDKYSKYSPLFQEVLNDPEYDELWRRYESGELKEYSGTFDSGVNLMEAIPYEFLASKGEDVEGIKGGTVAAGSDLYTIENEKNYIYDRLEIIYKSNNGENYINQYLLKYQISEQELEDLTMLYRGDYFQGLVMFQLLASKQQPEVITEFSITEKASKNILANCNNSKSYLSQAINNDKISSANIISMDPITLWNEPAYNLTFYLYNENGTNTVSQRELYEVDAQISVSACRLTNNNGIYDLQNLSALNPKLISSTSITYFHLSHSFKNFKA